MMMIRNAFHQPFVLPLALRIVCSNTRTLTLNIKQTRSISVDANGDDLVDLNLRTILKHEIKSLKSNLKNLQVDIPSSYPFKQVTDNKDSRNLTFENNSDKEWISICIPTFRVSVKEIVSNYEDDHKDKQEMKPTPAIPMVVTVRKAYTDVTLFFELDISPKGVIIEHFYFDFYFKRESEFARCEGPKFSELENELQHSLYKFLEVRGIKSNLFHILPKYIVAETYKSDINSLKALMTTIES